MFYHFPFLHQGRIRSAFILIMVLGGLSSCESTPEKSSLTAEEEKAKEIASYFNDLEALLNQDAPPMWGRSLYGPILIVNPESRVFYANENNLSQSFHAIQGIFTDTLPPEVSITNTAMNWEEKRWSMVMEPLPESYHARNHLLIHELFHVHQPSLGFDSLSQQSTAHLDQQEARILLKLELQALCTALRDQENAKKHIQDALLFRMNRHVNPSILQAENLLEINEGICEYTALMLSWRNAEQLKAEAIRSVQDFYQESSFLRSFAYETIPLYGYLLSLSQKDWHTHITQKTDLTAYFMKAFDMDVDKQDRNSLQEQYLAVRDEYEFDSIEQAEKTRTAEREKQVQTYDSLFFQASHLSLPLQNVNIAFDYTVTVSMKDKGTVYPKIRIKDNWGILEAEKGALINSSWTEAIVSQPINISEDSLYGEGWALSLVKPYVLSKEGNNYLIQKQTP